MWGTLRDRLWEILVTAAVGSYLIVGAIIVLFISVSFSWTKNWRSDVAQRDDEERNLRTVSAWTTVFLRFPVTFVLHVAIWPLYFAWYLDYLDAKDAEEENQRAAPRDRSRSDEGT